jgi:hypothetical protein
MLPMPKYDEQQQNYIPMVSPWQAMSIAIPVTARDIDRTTIIMEALSCESHYEVIPVYLETSLRVKQARDNESADMLDYIFANPVIDPVMAYNFGSLMSHFNDLLHTENRNLASMFESRIPAAESAIEAFLDSVANNP